MQAFFHEHFTPVDGKFVKTHTDSALARILGVFEGKKNALVPEPTSVGWRSWLRRAAFCLREFVSCGKLEEELHRSELCEVSYADLTNAQSIDEPLDDLDDEMREAIVRLVRAHVAESAAPLSLPLMIVCHGAKGVVQRVSKLAQIAHTDVVFKHREVSCVKYCTSQLNVRKLLVNAMDNV